MLVLGPKTAGPLLCRGLCLRRRCLVECATATLDITITIRNSRTLFLWCSFSRGILGFRVTRPEKTAFRGFDGSPPATRSMGGELPREFRKPRSTGGCGDRTIRRPLARRRAPLRTGHPLGARKRLYPQRGARQRTRRSVLPDTRFQEDRECLFARRPLQLSSLGSHR